MTTTVVIIVAVLLVAAIGYLLVRSRRGAGHGLRRRFGPEYDRTVARHGGDTKAAEHELAERVRLHGSLHERPLSPEAREAYAGRWAMVQETFIDSPGEAVAEADALLARLARDRGFPDGTGFEEQADALSVHHAEQVDGYRKVHHALGDRSSTEQLRSALVEARALFDVLLGDTDPVPAHSGHGKHSRTNSYGTDGRTTA
ncbi:hypothetical protein CP967_09475 [Streptomyces nitrosporeus]|uniref:Secreted protein n=1 Tax=Streptomyces nitrosporeus TaxID=28894 RepID=A0A5J6FAT4_9ACTN|nr:hypothetical protein [Streptomyces nitrosporeus]QEU72175.1 hypothetical protein CP967_09475 [Streptomyces nitrosporeus]